MPRSIRIMRAVAGIGLAVAVAALVISASVGAGFEREYKNALLNFNAHVIVMGTGEIDDPEEAMAALEMFAEQEIGSDALRWGYLLDAYMWVEGLLERVGLGEWDLYAAIPEWIRVHMDNAANAKLKGVVAISPFLYREALFVGPAGIRGVVVKGVDLNDEGAMAGLRIKPGAFKGGDGAPVLLGSSMAGGLGEASGFKLAFPSPGNGEQRFVDIEMVGTFESGMHDYDADFILMDIDKARRLFDAGSSTASGIEMRLREPDDAWLIASAAEERLGPRYSATTWGELNSDLLAAVRLERLVSAVIMGIMLVVAALNIVTVLVLTTIRRLPEIAMLKAVGLSNRRIEAIFVRGGFGVGIKGVLAGLAAGLGIAWLTGELGLIPLDAEIYMIGSLPIDISWSICAIVLLFCTLVIWLASKLTARRLGSVDPVEGLSQAR